MAKFKLVTTKCTVTEMILLLYKKVKTIVKLIENITPTKIFQLHYRQKPKCSSIGVKDVLTVPYVKNSYTYLLCGVFFLK